MGYSSLPTDNSDKVGLGSSPNDSSHEGKGLLLLCQSPPVLQDISRSYPHLETFSANLELGEEVRGTRMLCMSPEGEGTPDTLK